MKGMKTKTQFPLDLALEQIEEKVFNDPTALEKLKELEECAKVIDHYLAALNTAQARFDQAANEMQSILEVLKLRDYQLPNKFRVVVTSRREVEVFDEKAFLGWLKENFSADEIMSFLMPPTTQKDLKSFCTKWLDENPGESIPGINTEVTFIHVRVDHKGVTRVKKRRNYKRSKFRKSNASARPTR